MAAFLEIAAHSAYNMFSLYRGLIVNLVFSHVGFWNGNFFLIAHLTRLMKDKCCKQSG